MVNYRISNKAVSDLDEIWIYTFKNWSIQQADRYYDLIISEIEYLAKNPDSGISKEHIKKGYRASKVKSHLIFYKLSANNIVEVERILHQRMDIENRVKEE
jgi:toxin ParE1/3/4